MLYKKSVQEGAKPSVKEAVSEVVLAKVDGKIRAVLEVVGNASAGAGDPGVLNASAAGAAVSGAVGALNADANSGGLPATLNASSGNAGANSGNTNASSGSGATCLKIKKNLITIAP